MTTRQTDPMDIAYVVKGFWARATTGTDLAIARLSNQMQGEVGVQQYLIDAAAHLQWAFEDLLKGEFEGGVWAYEVAEPFGAWLAERVNAGYPTPDDAQMRDYLREELQPLLDARETEKPIIQVRSCTEDWEGNVVPCPKNKAMFFGVYEGPAGNCLHIADFVFWQDALSYARVRGHEKGYEVHDEIDKFK